MTSPKKDGAQLLLSKVNIFLSNLITQVERAKELVRAEGELTHKLNERHREDTEGAGSSRRRGLYTDRQQLLEDAARQGHEVDLPQQRPMWNDHGVGESSSNGKMDGIFVRLG